MLRPVAPFVEYLINYDYISKVLCINKENPELGCNGKCQLMQKLQQQQEEDFNSLRINMEEYPIGFVDILDIANHKLYLLPKSKNPFSYHKEYYFSFHKEIFHPPATS